MKTLSTEEIKPGMTITVKEWTSHKDNSWVGDLIEVIAVDLPFISVGLPLFDNAIIMDTRKMVFAQFEQGFIDATKSYSKKAVKEATS